MSIDLSEWELFFPIHLMLRKLCEIPIRVDLASFCINVVRIVQITKSFILSVTPSMF